MCSFQKLTDTDADSDYEATTTKTITKMSRRGSVKEMSKKFIDNAGENSNTKVTPKYKKVSVYFSSQICLKNR